MTQRAVPLFGSFIIGLAVVFGGPTNLLACTGYACKQYCRPTCGEVQCGTELDGSCSCSITRRDHENFTVVICKTFGGSCAAGCGGGEFPEYLRLGTAYQDFSFQGLRAAIAAGKQDAITARKHDYEYELVVSVLESFRGPQGFEIGHTQSDVMISRSLPNQYLEDGSTASEPARSASVSLEIKNDRMEVELTFSDGLQIFGEILDGGAAGVLRMKKTGQSLSVVSW